jgi:hypothetical protein
MILVRITYVDAHQTSGIIRCGHPRVGPAMINLATARVLAYIKLSGTEIAVSCKRRISCARSAAGDL